MWPAAEHVWAWFLELHAARGGGAGGLTGPVPIGYRDIADWAALAGVALQPWEVAALRAVDAAWLEWAGRQAEAAARRTA